MKILFMAMHRKDRAPGQRFRFEQYFDYLESDSIQCELSYLISEEEDRFFNKQGNYGKKAMLLLKSFFKRFQEIKSINNYDIVFVFRESFFLGGAFFEKMIEKSKAKLIVDFDDAIWIPSVSKANRIAGWLRRPSKINDIMTFADLVTVGNRYLADYASLFNKNVIIIPTTIDTNEYSYIQKQHECKKVCIGWSGSFSTIKHFQIAVPSLIKIKKKYKDKVYFKVIGNGNYRHRELDIIDLPWNKATELNDLREIDIGIMPLPNDKWSKGKCGLKGLQYMALGIPTLMSPVGVNKEIIEDNVNGFLPSTPEEWFEKLSLLIDNKDLRTKIGKKGRDTVIKKYSFEATKNVYLDVFRKLAGN